MHTHVDKIGAVIVESVTRGSVSFSGVSEGDRSAVLWSAQGCLVCCLVYIHMCTRLMKTISWFW